MLVLAIQIAEPSQLVAGLGNTAGFTLCVSFRRDQRVLIFCFEFTVWNFKCVIKLKHSVDAVQGFVRLLCEGREAVNNLIFECVKGETESAIKVEAVCVRTTKIHEDMVKIEV